MFKQSFSFEGRIRRTEYCISYILYIVLAGIINVIVEESRGDATILMLAYLPLLWFLFAQGAKRCHDLDNNGWFQLIPFYVLWMMFQNSKPDKNQYGDNPKGLPVTVGQSYQGETIKPKKTSDSGYLGGYSGGHNNPNSHYNQKEQESKQEGYKDGELYN